MRWRDWCNYEYITLFSRLVYFHFIMFQSLSVILSSTCRLFTSTFVLYAWFYCTRNDRICKTVTSRMIDTKWKYLIFYDDVNSQSRGHCNISSSVIMFDHGDVSTRPLKSCTKRRLAAAIPQTVTAAARPWNIEVVVPCRIILPAILYWPVSASA